MQVFDRLKLVIWYESGKVLLSNVARPDLRVAGVSE